MKKLINNRWILLLGVLVVGIFIGKLLGTTNSSDHNHAEHDHGDMAQKEERWTCSMHPQIERKVFGKCPICAMDLILVQNDLENEETLPDEIPLSESAMKLAEIQTYVVKKEKPEKEIRLLGKVKADERLMYSQAIHIPGRIEKLFINFTGEKVKKGQKLASVYSPELVTAQKELFEVLKDKSTSPSLVAAARSKLKQWKFSDEQIAELEKSGEVQTNIDILSNYDGLVMKRLVEDGDHVMAGQTLFEITDLSKVWLLFEAYENDLPWINVGDKISINLKSIPGKQFNEKVSFIDPFIQPKTRVAHVRVEIENSNGKLKPDMFANGIINSYLPIEEDVILVPKSSVLWTGKRAVVYVKLPNRDHSSFIYREITLGEDAGDFYLVVDGLKEGEEIASNGVFKIDAAAQLAGKRSMMNPSPKTKENLGEQKSDFGKQQVSSKFKMQLGNAVSKYMALKNKLVEDNSEIGNETKALKIALSVVNKGLLKENASSTWNKESQSIQKQMELLAITNDLTEQREGFLILSNSMIKLVTQYGVELESVTSLYLEFCPMADNNNGGSWLSLEKEIRNPYFGSSMLRCGSVKADMMQ